MTELERLQKNVVDTNAACIAADAAYDDAYAAFAVADADDAADDAWDAAYDAWAKAKLELANYLKKQDKLNSGEGVLS